MISLVVAVSFGAALGRVRRGRLFAAHARGRRRRPRSSSGWPWPWRSGGDPDRVADGHGGRLDRGDDRLDRRDAARSMLARRAACSRICTAAAIAGSFVGGVAAGPAAGLLGAPGLIGLEAVAVRRGSAPDRATGAVAASVRAGHPRHGPTRPVVADVRAGFDEVRTSPLLRLVAVAYVLFAVLLFSVSFPFLTAAGATFPDPAELAGTLGLINADRDRQLVPRVAAARRSVLSPVRDRCRGRCCCRSSYLGGFGVWVVSFSFATAAAVSIVRADHPARALERGVERVLQRRPGVAARPGPRVQGRRARADSASSCPASCC